MPDDERAFTRRQPGVNPIALELDRLAEQHALQTLGRGRPTLTPGAAPDPQQAYRSTLDRIRAAPGREGETDVLSGIPDDELAQHAKMANDEMDQAIASGQAYVTKDGDLYTRDANLDFSPHLALVHEQETRQDMLATGKDRMGQPIGGR